MVSPMRRNTWIGREGGQDVGNEREESGRVGLVMNNSVQGQCETNTFFSLFLGCQLSGDRTWANNAMTISLHLTWASLFLMEKKVCSLNPSAKTISWLQNQVGKKYGWSCRSYLQLETSILLIFWVSLPGGKPGKVDLVVVGPSGPGWVGGTSLTLSLIFMTWRDI